MNKSNAARILFNLAIFTSIAVAIVVGSAYGDAWKGLAGLVACFGGWLLVTFLVGVWIGAGGDV